MAEGWEQGLKSLARQEGPPSWLEGREKALTSLSLPHRPTGCHRTPRTPHPEKAESVSHGEGAKGTPRTHDVGLTARGHTLEPTTPDAQYLAPLAELPEANYIVQH